MNHRSVNHKARIAILILKACSIFDEGTRSTFFQNICMGLYFCELLLFVSCSPTSSPVIQKQIHCLFACCLHDFILLEKCLHLLGPCTYCFLQQGTNAYLGSAAAFPLLRVRRGAISASNLVCKAADFHEVAVTFCFFTEERSCRILLQSTAKS